MTTTLKQENKTTTQKTTTEECCPKFHPEKWDHKTFNWENKPFIKASVPTLFHIPFQKIMGKKIAKMMKQVEDAKKMEEDKENVLLLFKDPHAFRSDM